MRLWPTGAIVEAAVVRSGPNGPRTGTWAAVRIGTAGAVQHNRSAQGPRSDQTRLNKPAKFVTHRAIGFAADDARHFADAEGEPGCAAETIQSGSECAAAQHNCVISGLESAGPELALAVEPHAVAGDLDALESVEIGHPEQ